eukprot:4959182-Pyramimonas_sp.AAC.1
MGAASTEAGTRRAGKVAADARVDSKRPIRGTGRCEPTRGGSEEGARPHTRSAAPLRTNGAHECKRSHVADSHVVYRRRALTRAAL